MKKALSLVLAVVLMLSMATIALADNTPPLTTTVPAATYTLNIPANQEIPFGAESTDIGNITVTGASGFAEGKNLKVTAVWEGFRSDTVSTTIPFNITSTNTHSEDVFHSGDSFIFEGLASGGTSSKARSKDLKEFISTLNITVDSADWGKALAGAYTATITYTAEVVVEE